MLCCGGSTARPLSPWSATAWKDGFPTNFLQPNDVQTCLWDDVWIIQWHAQQRNTNVRFWRWVYWHQRLSPTNAWFDFYRINLSPNKIFGIRHHCWACPTHASIFFRYDECIDLMQMREAACPPTTKSAMLHNALVCEAKRQTKSNHLMWIQNRDKSVKLGWGSHMSNRLGKRISPNPQRFP